MSDPFWIHILKLPWTKDIVAMVKTNTNSFKTVLSVYYVLRHCISDRGQVDIDVLKKLYKALGQKSHMHR